MRWPAVLWSCALVVVLALGVWGFLDLRPLGPAAGPDRLPWVDAIYRTLRLFVVDLDLPAGTLAPWQLWVAAFAAPALTLRGIAQLFREQLDGMLTRYLVRPEVVVFGANDRAGALIDSLPVVGRWRRAVVVVDPDPQALPTVGTARVHRVRGDGAGPVSLRRAAVGRSRYVVVVTGDTARNAAIATAVRTELTGRRTKPEVYAEVEEPGLARTLEQGGRRHDLDIVPFSAAAMAAAAVLDRLERRRSLLARDPGEDGGPALALFGTGELVEAMVLELHRRREVQLLEPDADGTVKPRVTLFGPDAGRRRRALATLLGTELTLDLEAFDVDLSQVVELDVETARHLARSRPLRQVLVLTPTDLDGGGIAITLARHLGRRARIAMVTMSGSSPFGDEITRQSALPSASMAPVELFRVPDEAYSLPALRAERPADRYGRALCEAERGPDGWAELDEAGREPYRARADGQLRAVGDGDALLRGSALVAPRPAEKPLLVALGFDRPVALARAGLGVDFESTGILALAGRRLLEAGDPAAFGAWCELARLQTDPAALTAAAPTGPSGDDLDDVRELLRIRSEPAAAGAPVIMIVGGAGDAPETVLPLLAHTLPGLPAGSVHALLPPGPLRDRLAAAGARVHDGPGRRQALALWPALGTAEVRVLVLPGAAPQEVLLARALGARLGRLELPGAPELSGQLLGGAVDVLPLPPDRMIVRAFLRPEHWPDALREHREPLAAELQRRYVSRQHTIKPAGDPALQLWPQLSPWLRRSTLAVVDDIPTKLTLLGLRLADPAEPGPGLAEAELTARLTEHLDLLSEQEHGRFTAERLLAGWAGGVRDPARFMTPHLVAWDDLDKQAKGYDADVILDLPGILAARGIRVRAVG